MRSLPCKLASFGRLWVRIFRYFELFGKLEGTPKVFFLWYREESWARLCCICKWACNLWQGICSMTSDGCRIVDSLLRSEAFGLFFLVLKHTCSGLSFNCYNFSGFNFPYCSLYERHTLSSKSSKSLCSTCTEMHPRLTGLYSWDK